MFTIIIISKVHTNFEVVDNVPRLKYNKRTYFTKIGERNTKTRTLAFKINKYTDTQQLIKGLFPVSIVYEIIRYAASALF